MAESEAKQGGASATFAVASMALLFAGPLLCFYYVSCERTFYWWDYANYHNLSREASAAFEASWAAGFRYIGGTLRSDYNAIFTLPLLPFLRLFGDQRAVYLTAIYLVYLWPLLYVCGLLLKELSPRSGATAVWLGAWVAFLSTGYWRAVLRGYPDTAGAMLLAVSALLHLRRPDGRWRWRDSLLIGVALGTAVVLRRHYAYGAFALYAALGLDLFLWKLADSKPSGDSSWRELGRRALHLLVSSVAGVMVVALVTPALGPRALQIMSSGMYASWESTSLETARTVLGTVGGVPALLGIAGLVLHWRDHPQSRPKLRFLVLVLLIWLCTWVFTVRQAAGHYPHVVPLVVSLGIGALLLRFAEEPRSRRWKLGVGAVGTAVVLVFLHATGDVKALSRLDRLPRGVLSGPVRPLRQPGYQEQRELVMYLRKLGEEQPARVVVAASSDRLNYDILKNAEAELFRRPKLEFLATPQVDSLRELPTGALLRANYVVVASPFQHHLPPDRQKVVRVLVDVFTERWEFANDFELLPRSFDLAQPGAAQVWKRVRETPAEVAFRTDVRIARYVTGRDPAKRTWHLVASKFSAFAVVNPDGTSKLTGHPAKGDAPVQTTFQTVGFPEREGTLSGAVTFYDERCPGAELFVTTDAPDAQARSLGVFTPKQGRLPFRMVLPKTGPHALRLLVKSAPTNRQNIDFCTLFIDELQTAEAPP